MIPIQIENLKEKYDNCMSIYKSFETRNQRVFFNKFKEIKELKENALKSQTLTSKNYLLTQTNKRLDELNDELLEYKKKRDSESYKQEIEKLKKLFESNRNLSNEDKVYLAKKSARMNNFDPENFIEYLTNETKIMGSMVTKDINDLLTAGY